MLAVVDCGNSTKAESLVGLPCSPSATMLASAYDVVMLHQITAERHLSVPISTALWPLSDSRRGNAVQVLPAIREAENRELLWQGLADGVIDCVVSDHSPCTPDLKRIDTGDFGAAWGGIASLQLDLPAVWTGARDRGFALTDVVGWMAERPARVIGLRHKGSIAPGRDADLVLFAPDEQFRVDAAKLHHRNPVSPYHDRALSGVVRPVHRLARVDWTDFRAGRYRWRPFARIS